MNKASELMIVINGIQYQPGPDTSSQPLFQVQLSLVDKIVSPDLHVLNIAWLKSGIILFADKWKMKYTLGPSVDLNGFYIRGKPDVTNNVPNRQMKDFKQLTSKTCS